MNNLPKDLFGDDDKIPEPSSKGVSQEKETMLQRQTQLDLEALFETKVATEPPNIENEKQITDRYKVIKILGKGGMGVVYKVLDEELKRELALKMLLPQQNSLEAKHRFFQEAKAMAKLRHENIVSVHDIGEFKGNPYFTMDLIPGKDLPECTKSVKYRQLMQWMLKVCHAIHYIHEQGLIHRDLKPSNVMIANNNPVLMDFGIAKDMESQAQLTMEGRSIGTPAYMAPEQARGRIKEIDQRTDVYGLGAILYEILSGTPPFSGAPMQVIFKVCTSDPKSLKSISSNIPNDLIAIVEKAMSKDRQFRYTTANEMAKDIQRYLDGSRIQAQPVPGWLKWWRNAKRNPKFIYGGIAALVLFSIGIGSIWWQKHQEKFSLDAQIQELLQRAEEETNKIHANTPIEKFWEVGDLYNQVLALVPDHEIALQQKYNNFIRMAEHCGKIHDYELARAICVIATTLAFTDENKEMVLECKQKIDTLESEEKQMLPKKIATIYEQLRRQN